MAGENFDLNEISSHAAVELIENFLSKAKELSGEQIKRLRIKYGKGFARYLDENLEHHKYYRTILSHYDRVSLDTHYVPGRLDFEGSVISRDDFVTMLLNKRQFILEGTAGSGKTLFVKSLFCYLVNNPCGYVPILIEMRYLYSEKGQETIMQRLTKQIAAYVQGFQEDHLRFGLSIGKFALFLDGLDEIPSMQRFEYVREIIDMTYAYVSTPVLLSMRPSTLDRILKPFYGARLRPMERNQAIDMLSRLNFEPKAQEKFISRLDDTFFEKHREFLSVPLLCTLMMMSFSDFADVPTRMFIFYEQAFQTLFQKHDAAKGAFSRQIESSLDIANFRRILSCLSFISIIQERFYFLDYQITEDLSMACDICNISVDIEKYLNDLIVTVSLLQRDGLYLTFVHRSFQEYFSALYAIESQSIDFKKFVDKLMRRAQMDSTTKILMQMNREKMERDWVLPKIIDWMDKIESLKIEKDLDLVRFAFGGIDYQKGLLPRSEGYIHMRSLCFLLEEYSPFYLMFNYIENDEKIVNDYAVSKDEEWRKKYALGGRYNLDAFPADLVDSLEQIQSWASIIRSIVQLKGLLDEKNSRRSAALHEIMKEFPRQRFEPDGK